MNFQTRKPQNLLIMESEIKLLKRKVQDLSQENLALREINVQFQLENFKLKQKIKKMENTSHFEDPSINETVDESVEVISLVSFNDATFDPTAEYLEEDPSNLSCLKVRSKQVKQEPNEKNKKSLKTTRKRLREEISDDDNFKNEHEETLIVNECVADVYEESIQNDGDSTTEKEKEIDIDGLEVNEEIDPKEAAKTIYTLAAKRGILDKIKSLEGGKRKDSSYVNKILDLIFDRVTLANSSARGQKCQSKLHVPPRPALDPKKLQLCRQAFLYRLKREGLSYAAREERLKHFNNFVNFKIQNARKLLKK